MVSSTPRPHFTPRKDPVPILQEAGWAPGPVWTGGKPRPHRDSIPDRSARGQSLYRLSYEAHKYKCSENKLCTKFVLFRRQKRKERSRLLLCTALQHSTELQTLRRNILPHLLHYVTFLYKLPSGIFLLFGYWSPIS